MRFLIACFVAAALPCLAIAQDNSTYEERREAMMGYVNSPAMLTMMDDLFSAEAMSNQFQQMAQAQGFSVSKGKLYQISTLFADQMAGLRPKMMESLLSDGAATFTLEEIEALAEFYNSPIGTSVMAKMQPFMDRSMQTVMPEIMQTQQTLMPQVMQILMAPE